MVPGSNTPLRLACGLQSFQRLHPCGLGLFEFLPQPALTLQQGLQLFAILSSVQARFRKRLLHCIELGLKTGAARLLTLGGPAQRLQ